MPLLTTPDELANKTFDYIVVGAGTSGLALASRLTEDAGSNVLVLEAGGVHGEDSLVDVPAQLGATFGNPKYDWGFPVVKQEHANNSRAQLAARQGCGSSAMNFFCWIKPPAEDVNAFEKLGNPGWNWNEFEKYSKKSEKFHPAVKEITDKYPHTYDENFRGTDGPINVTDPIHAHTLDKIFIDTLGNKGIKHVTDPYGGDVTGTYLASNNVDPKTWKRSYSATGYWLPHQDRPNFHLLTGAHVSRVLWSDEKDADGNLIASGVEFISGDKKNVATAAKEVILSAGAIKSPHILELSGVGSSEILKKIDIPTKLELPWKHHFAWLVYELDTTNADHQTLDQFADPEFAKESLRLHAEGKGLHRTGITGFAFLPLSSRAPEETAALIDALEKDIKARTASGEISPALAKQYEIQLSVLKDDKLPDMEFIIFPGYFMAREPPAPGKRYISILTALNHPISRGYIHAKSNNPEDHPEINPNYFKENFDLKVLLEHAKFVRSLTDTEPFKSNCTEVQPGPNVTTDEQLEDYIKTTHITTFHTAGSCSMLPREDGGVVDPNLKVYGTKNVRVVDLSVVPLHVAAHMQTADIIKAGN
ncbi:GMC oxidoreductase [Ephemerocybe angulata]|uniref:pyranose dehydrogenase (acceptor) n=1 Tax=Ephemerocybe angulata TaxID=980116 RepID=A0A8H6HM10_9AGAR|nr:GMC oxidoreductase [Tulosesus angulatus]